MPVTSWASHKAAQGNFTFWVHRHPHVLPEMLYLGCDMQGLIWQLKHWTLALIDRAGCRDQQGTGVLVQTSVTFWGGSLHLGLANSPHVGICFVCWGRGAPGNTDGIRE